MNNSTSVPIQGARLLIAQFDLVATTTVVGTFYGIAFTLFCLYVHSLAPRLRNGERQRQARFMLVYSTIIMLCGLYILIANAWVAQDAYVKHSSYPGGPYTYELTEFLTTPVVPAAIALQVTCDVLTSGIQIWRVWVIWSATRYAYWVIVLPMMCFLTFTGLLLRTTVLDTTVSTEEDFQLDYRTDRAEIAIQGATTLLCTVLISVYLIFKQWQQRKLIGENQGATGYMSVVAMIIESYVLESVWLLATAILFDSTVINFFTEPKIFIEIIAYLLVQYRVASGQSYESQRSQGVMSSLRWNHTTNHATIQFEEAVEIQSGLHVSAVTPEAPTAGSDKAQHELGLNHT